MRNLPPVRQPKRGRRERGLAGEGEISDVKIVLATAGILC